MKAFDVPRSIKHPSVPVQIQAAAMATLLEMNCPEEGQLIPVATATTIEWWLFVNEEFIESYWQEN